MRKTTGPAAPTVGAPERPEPPAPVVTQWLAPKASPDRVRWVTPACQARVDNLIQRMTLPEKVGQMTQPDRGQLQQPDQVASALLGSVLSGGGSGPPRNEPAAWRGMVDAYLASAKTTRLGIPLLYGIDAVHGHNNVRGATIFPHNIGLGCTRDAALIERVARATAQEVRATGIDWTFAPVVAAPRNERWGRTYEGFGETEELATELGVAAIRGFQGPRLGSTPDGILACAKHFVADGATHSGIDRGNSVLTAEALRDVHLKQYQAAIEAGVGSIMASFSSVNGKQMHASRELLTELLKGRMGFEGFIVSDWQALELLPGNYEQQVERAINAGVDLVMGEKDFRAFQRTLTSLVPQRIPLARVDDAVRRILTVKCELGLFDAERTRPELSTLGSREHRALARQAVAESLVLLKNQGNVLPMRKTVPRLLIAGKNADDLGHQCGGWTITWQGLSGDLTLGTTIRRAIEGAVTPVTQVSYSRDGKAAGSVDVAIVVVGERPYAEGNGDQTSLELDAEDVEALRRARSVAKAVVLVLVSGRPLILGDAAALADAIVAAWLPGSEGQGVADVLFGDAAVTGKLSHTWPRSMAQIPINAGDPNYEPLYPYGYGLTYARAVSSMSPASNPGHHAPQP
jgi:beta-glucosidase